MLHENVVKTEGVRNKLHNTIKPFEPLVSDAILGKVFVFVTQQILLNSEKCITEIQDDVIIKTVVEAKLLRIFELQLIAELDKVFILKSPIVQHKIFKSQISFVNLSLELREARNENRSSECLK